MQVRSLGRAAGVAVWPWRNTWRHFLSNPKKSVRSSDRASLRAKGPGHRESSPRRNQEEALEFERRFRAVLERDHDILDRLSDLERANRELRAEARFVETEIHPLIKWIDDCWTDDCAPKETIVARLREIAQRIGRLDRDCPSVERMSAEHGGR